MHVRKCFCIAISLSGSFPFPYSIDSNCAMRWMDGSKCLCYAQNNRHSLAASLTEWWIKFINWFYFDALFKVHNEFIAYLWSITNRQLCTRYSLQYISFQFLDSNAFLRTKCRWFLCLMVVIFCCCFFFLHFRCLMTRICLKYCVCVQVFFGIGKFIMHVSCILTFGIFFRIDKLQKWHSLRFCNLFFSTCVAPSRQHNLSPVLKWNMMRTENRLFYRFLSLNHFFPLLFSIHWSTVPGIE